MSRISNDRAGGSNILALFDAIAFTEGTDNNRQPTNGFGYDVIVCGSLFTYYSRHPNKLVRLDASLSSTAIGRYQILYQQWAIYQRRLDLPDFGPINQDLYVINQIKESGTYRRIQAGEFEKAVLRINNIWPSLPGSPYGQHTYSMDKRASV